MRRLTSTRSLACVALLALAVPSVAHGQFLTHYYRPIDVQLAARQQWGSSATVRVVGSHLYSWRAVVGGRLKPIDMRRAVSQQYGSAYTLVAVGVHLYDWKAVRFSDLRYAVLPVMPIASNRFYDVNGVRTGLSRFRSVLRGVWNWYRIRVGTSFRMLQPLVIPTGRSTAAWNQLSANTRQAGRRWDLLDAAIQDYGVHLPVPGSLLRVVISPYVGDASEVWLGAASRGRFAVAPQRATSLLCPAGGPFDARCADATYAVGHELGHTWGLGHSCDGYPSDPDCSLSIMQSSKPWDAILLDPEIRKLVRTGFFRGSSRMFGVGCRGTNGRVWHLVSGLARIGRTQGFRLAFGPKSSVAILNLGLSSRHWGSIRLPFDLSPFGAPGCHAYAEPLISLVTATGATGFASIPLRHPNHRGLVGLRFYTQFVAIDRQANRWGATYTNGVATTLGS